MKPVVILYATREGQTRSIAEYMAVQLRDRELAVEVANVRQGSKAIDFNAYSAAILAASVHAGTHEPEMVKFVTVHRSELEGLPTAFVSVTLSQVGAERASSTPAERARFSGDVQKMLERFFKDSGWHPIHVKPVAGALRYSQYNFILKFIMKRIARKAGAGTDTSRDYEYTDWAGLGRFVAEIAKELTSVEMAAVR